MNQTELTALLLSEEDMWEYDGKFHILGGKGSGNFGHAGRPGKRGGSVTRGSVAALKGNVRGYDGQWIGEGDIVTTKSGTRGRVKEIFNKQVTLVREDTGRTLITRSSQVKISEASEVLKKPRERQVEAKTSVVVEESEKIPIEHMPREMAQQFASEHVRYVSVSGVTEGRVKDQELVTELLSKHPQEALTNLSGVTYTSTNTAFNREYNNLVSKRVSLGETADITGIYHYKSGNVVLRSRRAQTFHHEIGHGVWEASKAKGTWRARVRERLFDRHTTYSKTSGEEAFCESYAAWIAAGMKGVPKSKYAETFSAVEEVVRGVR